MADIHSRAAPAKINLYLHVTGRLGGGYHALDSLVVFAGVHDWLSAAPADTLSLAIDGPFADDLSAGDDNLVLKAARLLAARGGIDAGARLSLTKRLPVASGIGGGSADAAAALHVLSRLWATGLGVDAMAALALSLGADVPVCLAGRAAFIGGVGEALAPAPALPACSLLLVNPGRTLSTPDVFAAREGPFSQPARFTHGAADAAELAAILKARGNDLEAPAIRLVPEIAEVLAAIGDSEGTLLARMSGSGATCFGLYADAGEAAKAALAIGTARPEWWVKAGSLESDGGRIGA